MSYSSQLTALAWASERSLGRLVDEQVQENEKTRALQALEAGWDEARADGVVDGRELERLLDLAEAAGTGELQERLEALAEDGGINDEAKLKEAEALLRGSLREAHLDNTSGSTKRQLLLQLGMSEMKSLYESASAASRTEHQAYMTAIGNMKA